MEIQGFQGLKIQGFRHLGSEGYRDVETWNIGSWELGIWDFWIWDQRLGSQAFRDSRIEEFVILGIRAQEFKDLGIQGLGDLDIKG